LINFSLCSSESQSLKWKDNNKNYIVIALAVRNKDVRAFSLVEVVLALGVISFACLALLGLMATALQTFRQAINATVQAQITQAVINGSEVQSYNSAYSTTNYFSDEGTVVAQGDPEQLYTATVNAISTGLPLASGSSSTTATSVAVGLQVHVFSKSNPSVTNVFYLVWPKT
jgi:uncharacterized protein (TIGR02598 family)